MKIFKNAKWDADASGNNTYEELFKKIKDNKNKGKRKDESVIHRIGEKGRDKKQKRKLKKLLKKKYKDIISTDLVGAQTISENLIKSKNKKHGNNSTKLTLDGSKTRQGIGLTGRHEKGEKKEPKHNFNLDDLKNGVTKKQKGILKKYNSELEILNKDTGKIQRELLREKKKLKKLKRKSENPDDTLFSMAIEAKVKNKFDNRGSTEKLHRSEDRKKTKYVLDNKSFDVVPEKNNHTDEKKKQKENYEIRPSKNSHEQVGKILESLQMRRRKKLHEKLKTLLSEQQAKKDKPVLSLRQKMMEKLKAARFRFLNEQIYTTSSKEAQKIFKSDPDAFTAYHEGYRQQVRNWPLNPLDIIIKSIRKMSRSYVVADFGCGDAKLAKSLEQKVYSFDLVAIDDTVIACDMSKVPLEDNSTDVAVFCLSLMGTNLHDYILEANRVLKIGGLLKIAEVESRFEDVNNFIEGVQRFGFKKTWKDLSHNLFYFIDFKKQNNVKNKKKLPTISLLPCLYKKR